MFSVLMSLYEKEKGSNLKSCLESLKNQTYKIGETIIVYDGYVPEDLNHIIDEYCNDLNIKKIILNHNMGLGKALKIGLEHCSFNIVARMDTDDICSSDRFEKQIPYFINEKLDLLGTSIIEFDNRTSEERVKILPLKTNEIIEFSKFKNPFNHMTVVLNKDSIMKVGSYQHHLFMEDYNLWLRMIAKGMKIENLSDNTVYVRVDNNMLKRRRGGRYIKSELQLFKLKVKVFKKSILPIFMYTLIRCIVRALPLSILGYLYKKDRN